MTASAIKSRCVPVCRFFSPAAGFRRDGIGDVIRSDEGVTAHASSSRRNVRAR